jgi:hypothetical protein
MLLSIVPLEDDLAVTVETCSSNKTYRMLNSCNDVIINVSIYNDQNETQKPKFGIDFLYEVTRKRLVKQVPRR